MLNRYDMEHDYSGCYYEGDRPSIMPEESPDGEWVRFSDVKDIFMRLGIDLGLLQEADKIRKTKRGRG